MLNHLIFIYVDVIAMMKVGEKGPNHIFRILEFYLEWYFIKLKMNNKSI